MVIYKGSSLDFSLFGSVKESTLDSWLAPVISVLLINAVDFLQIMTKQQYL